MAADRDSGEAPAAGTAANEAPEPQRRLIVGLGNPGERYAETPHNLGFMVVDRLAERNGIAVKRRECQALIGAGRIGGREVMLAKPQTFMNLSGVAVKSLMEKFSFTAGELIVVYDDLDLPWTSLRIRAKGSSGGHKGMESIIRSIGATEFVRVRLGIHPGHPVSDGAGFVLAPFRRAQKEDLDGLLDYASQAVESIVAEGVEKAMTKFNRRAPGGGEEEE